MSKKLEGKTAVITGGTEGIGLATGKLVVKEGAYVFITGRRQKELDEAVKAIGANVSAVQGDVAQLADLDRLYATGFRVKGRIDIVVANAGVGEFVPFGAVTEEHFDKLFNINVRGTLFTVQKALPLLKDGGSIILTGSVASVKGTAAFGVYCCRDFGPPDPDGYVRASGKTRGSHRRARTRDSANPKSGWDVIPAAAVRNVFPIWSVAVGRSKSFSAQTISTATPRNNTDTSTGHFQTPSWTASSIRSRAGSP